MREGGDTQAWDSWDLGQLEVADGYVPVQCNVFMLTVAATVTDQEADLFPSSHHANYSVPCLACSG